MNSTFPFTIKPLIKMPNRIMYINESVIDCCLTGLYQLLKDKNYDMAKTIINDNINMMNKNTNKVIIDMDKNTYNKIIGEFYHMSVEIALKKYNAVHDRIRDIHYHIIGLDNIIGKYDIYDII